LDNKEGHIPFSFADNNGRDFLLKKEAPLYEEIS
jgi:hypothetical protein